MGESVKGVIAVLILIMLIVFFFGADNKWVCRQGEWVKMGEPTAPKPVLPCER